MMVDSLSVDSSWENVELPDAMMEGEEYPPDNTQIINPPKGACPVCGEEVVKEPGQRRRPKYHPECKPSANRNTGTRPVRVAAKERLIAEEVEEIVARAQSGMFKAVGLLALVNTYDAFVLHVNTPDLLKNLRVALYRFPWLRENAGNTAQGASLVGLGITVFSILLPIAANHGLIPTKKVGEILMQMPLFMLRMQEKMAAADGDADMSDVLLSKLRDERKQKAEAEMRMRTATETVNASAR